VPGIFSDRVFRRPATQKGPILLSRDVGGVLCVGVSWFCGCAMVEDSWTPSSLDAFLDRLLRGEAVDGTAFVAAHPELSAAERELVRNLCRVPPPRNRDPAEDPAPKPDAPPIARLGDYRLGRRIGAGAMGAVFLAEDETLGRQVAIKLIGSDLTGSGDRGERFLREVRAVAKLRHPNIVSVHAAGEHSGFRYMAMEHVPGASLHDVLAESTTRGARPPLSDVLRWGTEIADALAAAHAAGIVHRDVKPSNIRIATDGRAVLLDFGLAVETGAATITETGGFLGSPQYASPEQVGIEGTPIDARTDVYSLGATLYEAFTGVAPFRGETRAQLFHHILTRDPAPLRKLDPSIPRDLETVVLAAIEKDPRRRHQTAAALAADLTAVSNGLPVSVRPPSAAGRLMRWAKRQPAKAALVLALLIGIPVVAALGGFVVANLGRIERAAADERSDHLGRLLEEAFLELGEEGDATRLFAEAIKVAPESEAAHAGFALALIWRADSRGAIAFLDGLPHQETPSYWRTRIRNEALLRSKGSAESATAAETRGAPIAAIDHFVAGFIDVLRYHFGDSAGAQRAFPHLRQAVLLSRTPVAFYYYELGHAAWHAGRTEDAREVANAIERLFPESPLRWFAIGRALNDADHERSFDAYERAASPPPRSLDAQGIIVGRLAKSRRPRALERALEIGRESVARDPSRSNLHMSLGVALLSSGATAEAVTSFREAIRWNPKLRAAHVRLSEALISEQKPEEALAPASEAVRLDPNEHSAWNQLGIAQISSGRIEDAVGSFRKALALRGDASAHCNLGRALIKRGEFGEALEHLRTGHEKGSKDPRWRHPSAGWVEEAERLVGLENRLDDVRRGEDASAEELVNLVREVCMPQKRLAAAAALYARAFDLDPTLTAQEHPNLLLDAVAAALSAGVGGGRDAPKDDLERAALREQARKWFGEEIASCEALARSPATAARVPGRLAPWARHPELQSVRSGDLGGLAPSEVGAWRELWRRHDELLDGPALSR
jgi:tetratricopeptide (TPR) repeat protein